MDAFVGIYLAEGEAIHVGGQISGRVEVEAYRPIELSRVEVSLVRRAVRKALSDSPPDTDARTVAKEVLPGLSHAWLPKIPPRPTTLSPPSA
ncbi:MAG: hypothetical protein D6729_13790 [Deltaproteobacteria bacterium]|nr:MAG: hypothetical protein D6729_13790 [Deltaproteobacteria bacterium]